MNEHLEYIKRKKIVEIFERILGHIYFEKPTNIVEAIINELKKIEQENQIKDVFNEQDMKAMFDFVNLDNDKYICKEKCLLGLNQFVLNNKQKELIEKKEIENEVDLETFIKHAKDIINA